MTYRHDLHMQIYAVHQRAGDFPQIAHHLTWFTGTRDCGVVVVATRTRVHCRDEHKRCREINGIL